MGWLARRRKKKVKKKIKLLPAIEQGRALFNLRYPRYEYGVCSYGLPEVFDWGEGATLKIGSYCSIASDVRIFLGGHHRSDWLTTFPFPAFIPEAAHISGYNGTHGDVIVGSDVWLCSGCTILSGVTVGDGAVVAAGALVSKNVEPYSVVAGNPAKFIRWRFPAEDRDFLLETKWWFWPVSEVFGVVDLLCGEDISLFRGYVARRDTP